MVKKQTKLWIVIAVLALICLALSGITLAWFTDKADLDGAIIYFGDVKLEVGSNASSYTTASVGITRADGTAVADNCAMPGDKININITVKLTSESDPAYYLVYFDDDDMFSCDREFFFKEGSNVYATDGTDAKKIDENGNLTTEVLTNNQVVGKITSTETHTISFVQQIDPKATEDKLSGSKTFECTVYAIQQANMENEEVAFLEIYNKVNATVTFSGFTQSGEDLVPPAYQQAISDFYEYETISFYKTGKQPSTLTLNSTLTSAYDSYIDTEDKGKIKVYTNGDTKTELAFVSDYKIMAPESCNFLFSLYIQAIRIDESILENCKTKTIKFDNFKTDNVTNMALMFGYYASLTSLDLSMFNTSNVTTMGNGGDAFDGFGAAGMFAVCRSLVSLNLNGWDTSKVTNMGGMFQSCESLTALDVSKFNTGNVTDMGNMFDNCYLLTNLDVSKFDTSKVTKMGGMFSSCKALTNLDVSKFNTSNVTNMSYMFEYCKLLTSLDVSKFVTSKVTDMSGMFSGCSKLTSLDLSNFDTSNVMTMYLMFDNCSSLTTLDLSNFNTSNVTNMYRMFYGCSALKDLNLSSFDTSKVMTMDSMFSDTFSNNASGSTLIIGANFTNQGTAFTKTTLASTTSLNTNVIVKRNGSILS